MAQGVEAQFTASYADILRLAHARLSRERAPISTMTLAHELYLNLCEKQLQFETAGKFLAYASRAMRSLLVDMARERMAQKRAVELLPLTLGSEVPDGGGTPEQFLALDDALTRLASHDPRLVVIAEMRVIMGMEVSEVAIALELSEPTIKRDWQRAKAFLSEVLEAQP